MADSGPGLSESRHLYGMESKGTRQELPKRTLPRPERATGFKSFKRKRARQREALQQQGPGDLDEDKKEELLVLEGEMKNEARKRRNQKQDNFSKSLQEYANKKRKQMMQDCDDTNPEIAAKLREHRARAARNLEKMRNLEVRSMSVALQRDPLPPRTVVIATSGAAESIISRVGGRFLLWPESAAEAVGVAKECLLAPQVVWLCTSDEEERLMMFVSTAADWRTFNAAARLIGGFVVGPYWLQLVTTEQRLLPGIVQLKRGCDMPRQICCHKSLHGEKDAAAKAVCLVLKALEQSKVRCRWDFVLKVKNLLLVQIPGPSEGL